MSDARRSGSEMMAPNLPRGRFDALVRGRFDVLAVPDAKSCR
jgi:hypothetical protein